MPVFTLLSSNQNRQLLWGRARLSAVYWTHGGAVTYIGVGQQGDRVRRCNPDPPSGLNSWEQQALDPGGACEGPRCLRQDLGWDVGSAWCVRSSLLHGNNTGHDGPNAGE